MGLYFARHFRPWLQYSKYYVQEVYTGQALELDHYTGPRPATGGGLAMSYNVLFVYLRFCRGRPGPVLLYFGPVPAR